MLNVGVIGYGRIEKEALALGEYDEHLMLHCTHRNPEIGIQYFYGCVQYCNSRN